MSASDSSMDQHVAGLVARRPEAGAGLDARAMARLAEVVADPGGAGWMEVAGLLATDSCGYPVAGGPADVRGDIRALPEAAEDPELVDRVMGRLVQEWADDYVLTGRARLDRPWRDHLASAGRAEH